MDKNFVTQLTSDLYHLTLLFPKKEPLRYKMREVADDILRNSIIVLTANPHKPKYVISHTEKNLEVLDSFLEVAKKQNWVKASDILNLQGEYRKIKEGIFHLSFVHPPLKEETQDSDRIKGFPEKEKREEVHAKNRLKSPQISGERIDREKKLRHKRILEILEEKSRAQVWELKKLFPQVSKRTLRRDFEQLLNKGLIERKGERNGTFYVLNRVGA